MSLRYRYTWKATLDDGTVERQFTVVGVEKSISTVDLGRVRKIELHPTARGYPPIVLHVKAGLKAIKHWTVDQSGGGYTEEREVLGLQYPSGERCFVFCESSGRIIIQSDPEPQEPPLSQPDPWCYCGLQGTGVGTCVGCQIEEAVMKALGENALTYLHRFRAARELPPPTALE